MKEKTYRAIYGDPNKPLKIGNIEIPCYVIKKDGEYIRVLSGRGMQDALNLLPTPKPINETEKPGPRLIGILKFKTERPGSRLAWLLNSKKLKPLFFKDLSPDNQHFKIIKFTFQGKKIHGYDANMLAHICDTMLEARKQGLLENSPRKQIVADQCEILMRSFAKVGIIALIDEATGYQEVRERDELSNLLSKYLSEERLAWAKTFPDEFYKQIYRLKDWDYPTGSTKRTPYIGRITNQIVYEKLPPGVIEGLQEKNEVMPETKRRKWKHFQFLSEDLGQPDLRNHLLQVITLMRVSNSWIQFERLLKRAFRKKDDFFESSLPNFDDDNSENN